MTDEITVMEKNQAELAMEKQKKRAHHKKSLVQLSSANASRGLEEVAL